MWRTRRTRRTRPGPDERLYPYRHRPDRPSLLSDLWGGCGPLTKYRVTYYTRPGSTLTRQHTMTNSLDKAKTLALSAFRNHREHGPVRIWVRTHSEWEIVTTDIEGPT